MSYAAVLSPRHLTSLALALLVGSVSAAAADVWDDRGVKVVQTSDLRFPPSLLLDGVTQGRVQTVIEVDADGRLVDFLVTGFTHRELALELQRSMRTFDFVPARQRGVPVRCRFEVVFAFEAHGAVVSLTPTATITSQLRGTLSDPMITQVARMTELDQPLVAVEQVAPPHPGRALSPPAPSGRVQIDFYIDGDGRPRMPVVVRSSGDAFAAAAVDALLQWRFAPPKREGRPIAVRVVQEFVFAPPADATGST